MLNRFKKNDKKGFTLVELIVVLVILAILAALLIPALTGYIDRAKEKQVIAETRQVVMAAQTLLDEKYAYVDPDKANGSGGTGGITLDYGEVKALAEVDGTITADSIKWSNKGVISELEYEATNGIKCMYNTDSSVQTELYKIQ